MAITDFDNYIDRLKENRAADFQMAGTPVRPGRTFGAFDLFLPAPGIVTSSVALNKDSAQAMGPIPAINTGSLQLLGARLNSSGSSGIGVILVDLLNISAGLNGTVTTAQTTNLPTAALIRYTSGEGVMAAIFVESQIGTSITTFTVSYTNQAGTSGRISPANQIGGTNFREAGVFINIPLEGSDTGIRSVESVTLAASTITVGSFGVCLYKPLAMLSMESFTGVSPLDMVSTGGVIGQFAEINPNACLSILTIANTPQLVSGSIIINEV